MVVFKEVKTNINGLGHTFDVGRSMFAQHGLCCCCCNRVLYILYYYPSIVACRICLRIRGLSSSKNCTTSFLSVLPPTLVELTYTVGRCSSLRPYHTTARSLVRSECVVAVVVTVAMVVTCPVRSRRYS